jgi:hypothetical protein
VVRRAVSRVSLGSSAISDRTEHQTGETQPIDECDTELRLRTHTPAPDLRYEHPGLWVEFRFLPEHTMATAPEVTGEVTEEVTEEVERLVLELAGRMSRAQLQQALSLRHENHFRANSLIPALQSGLLEMTIPDMPKSSRQQYRLTTKGEALRAKLPKKKGT